ncbi:hypothetical protein TRFO_18363 [Tritrichomonas foetus]|uniref:Uncharacterized protein n=1 Tax=Tritrichomonas foetus TaxID=1144522 RepID=A0A1J4KQB3_9EUKA|nr:hypothetical protein TRFO_18363 [Tritrichomonas foetus]|eukprot:OHT11980.1 hypothetical protein TRFO_18363 [Tritrichomonas foetus]
MNSYGVPQISINGFNNNYTRKRKANDQRKFIGWDKALEDLLAQPITDNLDYKDVEWKLGTRMSADTVPIDIDINLFNANNANLIESNSSSNHVRFCEQMKPSHQSKSKARQMRTREVMVRNMITSPMTPRKSVKLPKTASTQTAGRAKTAMRDKKEVETIIHNRAHRPMPLQEIPVRKTEHMQIARTFDVHMTPSIRNAMSNRYFY